MSKTREEKQAKFKELAVPRVIKAVKSVRLISNLGNKSNYECTDDQIEKIRNMLTAEIDNVVQCLEAGTAVSDIFDLD